MRHRAERPIFKHQKSHKFSLTSNYENLPIFLNMLNLQKYANNNMNNNKL